MVYDLINGRDYDTGCLVCYEGGLTLALEEYTQDKKHLDQVKAIVSKVDPNIFMKKYKSTAQLRNIIKRIVAGIVTDKDSDDYYKHQYIVAKCFNGEEFSRSRAAICRSLAKEVEVKDAYKQLIVLPYTILRLCISNKHELEKALKITLAKPKPPKADKVTHPADPINVQFLRGGNKMEFKINELNPYYKE